MQSRLALNFRFSCVTENQVRIWPYRATDRIQALSSSSYLSLWSSVNPYQRQIQQPQLNMTQEKKKITKPSFIKYLLEIKYSPALPGGLYFKLSLFTIDQTIVLIQYRIYSCFLRQGLTEWLSSQSQDCSKSPDLVQPRGLYFRKLRCKVAVEERLDREGSRLGKGCQGTDEVSHNKHWESR